MKIASQQILDERGPEVRVYAQSAEVNPRQHATMMLLKEKLPALEPVMMEQGITKLEFMPPLHRGGFMISPDLDFEMFVTSSHPDDGALFRASAAMREAILNETGLLGKMSTPLTDVERTIAVKLHGLIELSTTKPLIQRH